MINGKMPQQCITMLGRRKEQMAPLSKQEETKGSIESVSPAVH
jgi:hypothetical protein